MVNKYKYIHMYIPGNSNKKITNSTKFYTFFLLISYFLNFCPKFPKLINSLIY